MCMLVRERTRDQDMLDLECAACILFFVSPSAARAICEFMNVNGETEYVGCGDEGGRYSS